MKPLDVKVWPRKKAAGLADDFRTVDWIKNILSPESIYKQSGHLLHDTTFQTLIKEFNG